MEIPVESSATTTKTTTMEILPGRRAPRRSYREKVKFDRVDLC
ncbi:unnamed protein product [Linum tenue]|uniref:Uncharacterized protein n=1 Tax=Linum tenue TaxID=586396 RepID=A0AAV0NH10_9ROSI|nr:unnamed protein product [Linum tenue]CAI0457876.1 unnamed protein product [Linum tenue]